MGRREDFPCSKPGREQKKKPNSDFLYFVCRVVVVPFPSRALAMCKKKAEGRLGLDSGKSAKRFFIHLRFLRTYALSGGGMAEIIIF
ncbi:hypothetical protein [Kaistia sp. 32K]|uniref:hypothetical protein n=1 Tax=Kaistia sp. 32K TaxID=2795690 RepID=UPI001AEEF6D2|nr:hypothetical protein [Kaistia sp. 32K]